MAARLDVGKTFLQNLLAHIPEDQRGTVAEAFEAAPAALETIGDGVLRQQDYSRQTQDLERQRTELNDWYEVNKAALARAAADPAGAGSNGAPAPRPVVTGVSQADMEKFVAQREAGVGAFIAESTPLAIKHFQTFGEVLDIRGLLANPRINDVGLQGLYNETFKDRYDARAKEADDKRLEAAREEGRREMQTKILAHPTGYVPAGSEASTLAHLNQSAEQASQFGPDAAAADYLAAVARRASTGG